MTDLSADHPEESGAGRVEVRERIQRRSAPIVPAGNIAGRTRELTICDVR